MTWTCIRCGAMSSEIQSSCPFCKTRSLAATTKWAAAASNIALHHWSSNPIVEDKEPSPEPETELVAQPIIGWREWNIATTPYDYYPAFVIDEIRQRLSSGEPNPMAAADTPFLKAVSQSIIWPFTHAAKCTKTETHQAPVWDCFCGIYAHKEQQRVLPSAHWPQPRAWGSVLLWGKIIEHEHGYRAQYAKPDAIETVGLTIEQATLLANAYDCCVTCHYQKPT